MGNSRKYRDPKTPRQIDELARLKVIQGPDNGSIYVITAQKVTVGRGEECDVVLADLRASRKHVELRFAPGGWEFKDLGSANGVQLGGANVREGVLKSGDAIFLGETGIEFFAADSGTALITAPARTPEQIRAERVAFQEQRERVLASAGVAQSKSTPAIKPVLRRPAAGGQANGARIVLIALLGVAAYFYLFEEEEVATNPSKKPVAGAQKKPAASGLSFSGGLRETASVNRAAEVFFKEGFREYRAGNYLRARQQFQTALQVAPMHEEAKRYLDKTEKSVDELVKRHLRMGNKSLALRRFRNAKSHYESVLRVLNQDSSHPGFQEAQDQLKKVDEKISGKESKGGAS